jgi:HEAT repeat protein
MALNPFPHGPRQSAPIEQVYVPPCFRAISAGGVGWPEIDRSRLRRSQSGLSRRYQWEGIVRTHLDQHTIPSIDHLLENHRHVVVVGDVGTGKSTLLTYIAWSAAGEGRPFLPLFFSLRTACQTVDQPLQPVQPADWCEGVDGPFFGRILKSESCILLFDGLDEVDLEKRPGALAAIEKLAHRYPDHHFVITTRPDALPARDGKAQFREVMIDALDPARLERWVRRFYRSAQPRAGAEAEGARFVEVMRDSDSPFSGVLSPLLLKALANLQTEGLDLRCSLHELCYQCLRLLLEEWDASKGIANIFLLDYKLRILQPIALWLLRSGNRQAPTAEVIEVARQRGEALGLREEYIPSLLDEIARRNGLLVARGPEHLAFAHPWLQHYLAARELREGTNGPEELVANLGDPDWEKTSQFYAGLGDATYLVGLLLGADDPFQRHLLLAGQCAALAPKLALPVRQQTVAELIRLSQTSPFEPVTSRAVKALAQIGTPGADEHLRWLLHSEDEDRRRQAFVLLGSPAAPTFIDALEEGLKNDPARHIRGFAADALGRLGGCRSVGALRQALGDPAWEVRVQALKALGWCGTPDLVPIFTGFLEQGYWHHHQQRSAICLAALFAGMEDQILEQSAEDKDGFIRMAAAQGLVALEHEEAGAALQARLVHPNWHVRINAAYGALLAGLDGVGEVLSTAVEHPDASVRYTLTGILNALAIHYLPEKQYIEIAAALLRDPAWRVRGGLLSGWTLNTSTLLELIEEGLEHPMAYVHVRAARALGYIYTDAVTRRLLFLLESTRLDGQVLAACESLRRHRCADAEPLVLKRLEEGYKENVAPGIFYYLIDLGTLEALPYLRDCLQHSSSEIRGLAFEALRRICGRHHLSPPDVLREALSRPANFETVFMRRYDTAVI